MAEARLEVTDAFGQRTVTIDKTAFAIGRRDTNDLRLAGSEVSRDHAEIAFEGGKFVIRDRGSRYGTLRQRRPDHRARPDARRQDPARARRRRRDGLPRRRTWRPSPSRRRRRRPSATCGTSRRCWKGCARSDRAACSTTCWRWCSTRRSTSATPSAGSSCWPTTPASSSSSWRGRAAASRIPGRTFETSRKIPEEVFESGRPRIVADLLDGDLANVHMGTVALGIRNVLCVPLRLVRYLDQAEQANEEERDRRALPRQPRARRAAVELHAHRARDAGHRGGRRHRERAPLPRDAGEGAARAGDADRGRDPAGADAANDARRRRTSRPRRRRCRAGRLAATSSTTWSAPTGASASRWATWRARGRRRRC